MDFPLLVRLKSLGLLLREQLDTYDRASVAALSFKRAFSPVVLILRSWIAQLRLIASTDLVSVFIIKHFGANCNVRVQVLNLFRLLSGAGRTYGLLLLISRSCGILKSLTILVAYCFDTRPVNLVDGLPASRAALSVVEKFNIGHDGRIPRVNSVPNHSNCHLLALDRVRTLQASCRYPQTNNPNEYRNRHENTSTEC